ncbi:hypothetical protein J437_LFUL011320 [Ladona fulva]|uniref:Transposase n=1 Tax=Ladona fulva TaxID=123851 RepID=A0A8K0KLL1_LADFU|nr:hypothetical protein J437_LFUL011320 [Ladona fulva]
MPGMIYLEPSLSGVSKMQTNLAPNGRRLNSLAASSRLFFLSSSPSRPKIEQPEDHTNVHNVVKLTAETIEVEPGQRAGASREVFELEQKSFLCISSCGLTPKDVRRFAYTYAVVCNCKIPPSWTDREIAGVDWFSGFMKRHNLLSIRSAQATSLTKASFNEINVKAFFKNLTVAKNSLKIGLLDIWNIDETGLTTVHKPNRVIGQRGFCRIGRITPSQNEGVLLQSQ